MATGPTDRLRDAHYHPVKASAKWKEFVQAELGLATQTPDARARKDAERKRETTYSRGTLGEH